jgi:hypothetical protein
LNSEIQKQLGLPNNPLIEWLSPQTNDEYAEYRDTDFLKRLGINLHTYTLKDFWPERGPQWDALGKANNGTVFLVEAKAHISETISHLAAKSPASKRRILASLQQTKDYLNVKSRNDWASPFYQYANRIASDVSLLLISTLFFLGTL